MLYTGHAVDDSSTTAHVKSCLVEIYVIFQSTLRCIVKCNCNVQPGTHNKY